MKTKQELRAQAIKTPLFKKNMNLLDFILENTKNIPSLENSVLAVTSKIVSLSENALVSKNDISKLDLIKRESDLFLGEAAFATALTIKHGLLIPSAGIDESNAEDDAYILFPQNPYESAKNLCNGIKAHYKLKNFGIIITDSHTHPLRRGVTGIGLSHWGFLATRKLIGEPDLFGRELKMTYVNVLDALSVAAVFMMGESNESQPLALLQGIDLEFTNESHATEVQIPLEEDIYKPLIEKYFQK